MDPCRVEQHVPERLERDGPGHVLDRSREDHVDQFLLSGDNAVVIAMACAGCRIASGCGA